MTLNWRSRVARNLTKSLAWSWAFVKRLYSESYYSRTNVWVVSLLFLSKLIIFLTAGSVSCWARVLNVAERFDQNSYSPCAVR